MENNKKEITNIYFKNLQFSIFICFYISDQKYKKIDNKLLEKLLPNYESIKKIIDLNIPETIKFLYNNKEYIHKILYIAEENISIETCDRFKNEKNNLSYLFYLNLLIAEDSQSINYIFSFDFINNIFNIFKNLKEEKYKIILLSKIIIELINNLENDDKYVENENEKSIKSIKKLCEEQINNNINIFKENNLDLKVEEKVKEIKSNKIDKLYIKIIVGLLKNKELSDKYIYNIYNIINQLDLEKINLSKIILDELFSNLDDDLKKNLLSSEKDLNNENKINFYYIILKYILKNSFYIYQIPILLRTKKIILNLLRRNKILYNNENKDMKENKLLYIIKIFADSEYYFQQISENEIVKLKEILNYYKNILFKSKKEEIISIENIIKNNKGFCKEYLKDYNEAIKNNKRFPIIKYLYNNENNNADDEEQIKKNFKDWNNFEEMIKKRDIRKINDKIYLKFLEYFNNKKNQDILLDIFNKEDYDYIKQEKNQKETEENSLYLVNIKNKDNNLKNNNISFKNNDVMEEKSDSYWKNNNAVLNSQDINYSYLCNSQMHSNILNDIRNENNIEEISDSTKINLNSSKIEDILTKFTLIIPINENNINNCQNNDYNFENSEIDNNTIDINLLDTYIKEYENKKNKNYQDSDYSTYISKLKKLREFIDIIFEKIKKKKFQSKNKLKIILTFEKDSQKSNEEFIINCKYEVNLQNIIEEDKDILNNLNEFKNDQNNNFKFKYFLNRIDQKFNSKDDKSISSIKGYKDSIFSFSFSSFIDKINSNINSILEFKNSKELKITIIEFINSYNIEENNSADYIKKISKDYNDYIICGGPNLLKIFNPDTANYGLSKKIDRVHNSIYPVHKKKGLEILINSNEKIETFAIHANMKEDVPKKLNEEISCRFCLSINKIFFICNKNGFFQYSNILGKIIKLKGDLITEETFWGGIVINNSIIAITSNKILSKGKDKLCFYNINSKNFIKEISGYSFVLFQNNLSLILKENNDNCERLLLCACKKYIKGQKNGILYVKIKLTPEFSATELFYESKNFEVYCFCPISKTDNTIFQNNTDKNIYNEYFYVGGFDTIKHEGLIKLFKINYNNDKFENAEIEFISDIKFKKTKIDKTINVTNSDITKSNESKNKSSKDEKRKGIFRGFKGPITCIYQYMNLNEILITCFDGNLYQFKTLNINTDPSFEILNKNHQ